jgi:hypothetical protein
LGVFLGASHAEPLYLQPAFVKLKLKKKELVTQATRWEL